MAAASAVVLIGSAGLSDFIGRLNGNISTESLDETSSRLPPPSRAGVLNILALGSQTRDGQGPGFGHDPGTDLSDTLMLIHLNAAHDAAVVLSIPRDLLVYRPPCTERTGGTAVVPAEQDAMIDSAMNLGGPACAVATVQDMSGIRIDHFIRIDFNGFRTMTDLLGGVQVCVPPPGINDWRSHLDISPGLHLVTGNQALAFVRDRHGIGNGGDLDRIKMQQMFISSLIQKVMSAGTLSNPVALYQLAGAATRSLTTDPGLNSVQKLLSLAVSLRGLPMKHITFITLPNELDPTNVDRLIPEPAETAGLWRLLRADQQWTGELPAAQGVSLDRTGKAGLLAGSLDRRGHGARTDRRASGPATPSSPSQVEIRNATENICSGLPTPNSAGALPGSG